MRRYSRRLFAAISTASIMALAAACTSGPDHTDKTTPSPRSTVSPKPFDPEKLGIANTLDPRFLPDFNTAFAITNGRPAVRAETAECAEPAKVERHCRFTAVKNRGAVDITTYLERPGQSRLYKAVLAQQSYEHSRHAFTGNLAKEADGYYISSRGTFVGAVFHIKHTGAVVVMAFTEGITRDRMGKSVFEVAAAANTKDAGVYGTMDIGRWTESPAR